MSKVGGFRVSRKKIEARFRYKKKAFGVFEGCGAKGLVQIGVLKAKEKAGFGFIGVNFFLWKNTTNSKFFYVSKSYSPGSNSGKPMFRCYNCGQIVVLGTVISTENHAFNSYALRTTDRDGDFEHHTQ
jgi:hypothetical protein